MFSEGEDEDEDYESDYLSDSDDDDEDDVAIDWYTWNLVDLRWVLWIIKWREYGIYELWW